MIKNDYLPHALIRYSTFSAQPTNFLLSTLQKVHFILCIWHQIILPFYFPSGLKIIASTYLRLSMCARRCIENFSSFCLSRNVHKNESFLYVLFILCLYTIFCVHMRRSYLYSVHKNLETFGIYVGDMPIDFFCI